MTLYIGDLSTKNKKWKSTSFWTTTHCSSKESRFPKLLVLRSPIYNVSQCLATTNFADIFGKIWWWYANFWANLNLKYADLVCWLWRDLKIEVGSRFFFLPPGYTCLVEFFRISYPPKGDKVKRTSISKNVVRNIWICQYHTYNTSLASLPPH